MAARYRSAVVGRILEMNDRPHRVVGVLPPLPRFPEPNDVFMPISSCPFRSAPAMSTTFSSRMVGALARLRPGATVEDASDELAAIAARLRRDRPEAYRDIERRSGRPLTEALTRRAVPPSCSFSTAGSPSSPPRTRTSTPAELPAEAASFASHIGAAA
jgi:hypothetical protein